jgi:hypothetical protein
MLLGHGRCTLQPFPLKADIVRMWDVWVNGKGIGWKDLEPSKGVYDFTLLDKMLAANEAMGAQSMYCFGYTPAWAAQPSSDPWNVLGINGPLSNRPCLLQDWTDFIYRFVFHVKRPDGTLRIKYWETWNEVNALGFWDGSYVQLLAMQKVLFNIIKSKDPSCFVTTPTPCMNLTTADQAMDSLLSLGIGDYADIITFHGYLKPGEPAANIGPTIDKMYGVMKKYGCNLKKLIDSESGSQQVADPDGQWLRDWIAIRRQKRLDGAIWYQGDNVNYNGSLFLPDHTLNAAGKMWQSAYSICNSPLPAATAITQVM